jgi:hypothetical protein
LHYIYSDVHLYVFTYCNIILYVVIYIYSIVKWKNICRVYHVYTLSMLADGFHSECSEWGAGPPSDVFIPGIRQRLNHFRRPVFYVMFKSSYYIYYICMMI